MTYTEAADVMREMLDDFVENVDEIIKMAFDFADTGQDALGVMMSYKRQRKAIEMSIQALEDAAGKSADTNLRK